MCGIVGGIAKNNLVPIMLDGLSRLEYRGYDSVGIAVVNAKNELQRARIVKGGVKDLAKLCDREAIAGCIGIGHTRWATHGAVNLENTHPHFSSNTLAVVHNGIIENYAELKVELQNFGYTFDSHTDTEVIIHMVHYYYEQSTNLLDAVQQTIKRLNGAYAIAVMCKNSPQEIICARFGSPLVIGVGIDEMFLASDIYALLPVTQKVVYLEDGDVAKLELTQFSVFDQNGVAVKREINLSALNASQTDLGQYRHYMQKEIFEQPDAIANTLLSLGTEFTPLVFGKEASQIFADIDAVQIIACGTSYNAGLVAKYWIEEIANLACNVDIASEFRYRKIVVNKKALVINISQSGETADTLACIKYVQELGMLNTLSISNVAESSLSRISKLRILTHAGREIGVASTKAFTTQLVVLLYLAFTLAKVKGRFSEVDERVWIKRMLHLPQLVLQTLSLEPILKNVAKEFADKQHALFLGRHTLYPIAIEGALKLKEISYIHAESYAAGELKHGPLALIDKEMMVVVLMPSQVILDKVKSNVQEILVREGKVFLFTDCINDEVSMSCYKTISMPFSEIHEYLIPIIYTIPLQLLSYHTALIKGTDVDKPRNLAKSVTVE